MKQATTKFNQLTEKEQYTFMKNLYEISTQFQRVGFGIDGYGLVDNYNYKKFNLDENDLNKRFLVYFTFLMTKSSEFDHELIKESINDLQLNIQNKRLRYFNHILFPNEGYGVLLVELV